MDFIIELVIELLLEGSIEISSNKKVSRWIRYPLILFIVTLFAGIILLMLYLSFSLLNKKQITEKSFTKGLNRMHLTKEASALILREIDNKLLTTIKHKELNKVVTYQYLMRLECYKLVKHLLGEKEYDGFRIWW